MAGPPLMNLQYQNHGRWIVADLHVHSTYSGGSLTPGEILEMAKLQLLDAVAISDHRDYDGALEGQAISAQNPMLPITIVSQEISAGNHFHFLLLGGTNNLGQEPHHAKLVELFATHHEKGGAIILAHPWTMPKNTWSLGFLKEITGAGLLDAVEIMNSSILEQDAELMMSIRDFWEEWVVPFQLGVTGGSDFHYHRQGRLIGCGRTYLKVFLPGEAGILHAIRNRSCVAGLFSYRSFQLGWLGSGNQTLIGLEPHLSELIQFRHGLHQRITQNWFLKPELQKLMLRLSEIGQYTMVEEMLNF